jgi:hypothetical protein
VTEESKKCSPERTKDSSSGERMSLAQLWPVVQVMMTDKRDTRSHLEVVSVFLEIPSDKQISDSCLFV